MTNNSQLSVLNSPLPKGWEVRKLSELFYIKSSKRVHKADWKEEGVPFYRAREVVKLSLYGFVNNSLFISQELYDKYTKEKGAPKENDIIISAVGTLGKCYLVKKDDKFYIKDASVLWFENISKVNSRYIDYAFKSDLILSQVMNKSMGATVGTLTISRAKLIQIPVPPLPEQQRIVKILDKAFVEIDKAKQNAEQNLRNAKEVFQSKLQSIFDNGKLRVENGEWVEKRLNEISDNLDSQRVPITKIDRKPGDIPYYGASGIVDYVENYLFDEDLLCISEDGANLLARTYPIAFHISGKTWVNNHAHILRFKEIVTQQFVGLYLNSIKLDDFVSGMAQPKLNQTQLNKIQIPLPPFSEQKQIVAQLDALSAKTKKLETIYQQKLDNLAELKKSILQKAFRGEL